MTARVQAVEHDTVRAAALTIPNTARAARDTCHACGTAVACRERWYRIAASIRLRPRSRDRRSGGKVPSSRLVVRVDTHVRIARVATRLRVG